MLKMYNSMMKIDRYLTKIIDLFLGVLFMAIFIMVFYQVILRYVFSTSIFGTAEVYTMFFTWASAMGAALMLRKREHIKIDVLINRLPRKAAKVVLTINYSLIAVLCFFIAWESLSWLNTVKSFLSPVTGISRAVESITIPIAFFLMIFYCALNILSLYLNPEEAEMEFTLADEEIVEMIDESKKADERFREGHDGREGSK